MATNRKRLFERATKLRGWLLLDKNRPLLYEKEAIYKGDWAKLDSDGKGIAFAVFKDSLRHWAQSVAKLRQAGIKIPLAKSHDDWDQPEDRLGEVVGASVRENDKGQPALYLNILFDDEKSRDIGLKGDVSIGSPETWFDGTGREWSFPLQHVASTNAPVIPGLETWRKIAASFGKTKSPSKGSKMDPDDLIQLLGLEVEDGASDDTKWALIKQHIQALVKDEADEQPEAPDADDADGAVPPAKPVSGKKTQLSHEEVGSQKNTPVPQAKRVTVAFSHPVIVRTVRDARAAQLDALVEQQIITPAVRKELALSFCTDESIKLELSHENADGGGEFERAIKFVKLAAKDRPLKDSGRTPAGDMSDDTVIELAHNQKNNGLVKNAEKRAERAKALAGVR